MKLPSDNKGVGMLPAERRAVGVVALLAVLRMFGLFALLPVLSLYAATLEDQTPMLVGLAVGAYGLTQAGLQVPLGAISDRIGRVPVIVVGLAVFAAGSVLAAMSDTIWGVIAGRLLQGAGAISATLTALVADATRDEVRTKSMAIYGAGFMLAFVLAFVGGPIIASAWGVPSLFWIAAGLALVGASMLLLLPAGVEREEKPQLWNLKPALRLDLLQLDFYVFLLHAIITATFVAMPFLLTRRLAVPLGDHWMYYVGALLLSLVIAVPMILKDHHQGRRRFISLSVVLVLVAQAMLALAGFLPVVVFLALVLFFAGFTFLEAGLPARLSVMADEEVRGASLGVFSTAQFLGAFVGGLVGGRFMGAGRPADVFIVCALLAAIWLAQIGLARR
ncbi:MAG: MFS transporter [Woeseiaceae bacterium]|nr:MFS transporter [Woeseiaceae bacterium]